MKKKFIVATSRNLAGEKNVEFVKGDICKKIKELQTIQGGDIRKWSSIVL
jgi:hypothetical protein